MRPTQAWFIGALILALSPLRAQAAPDFPDQGPGEELLLADAGPGGPGHEGGMRERGRGMGPELEKELGLSAEQTTKLKALRRARRDKMQASKNALQDAREDLRELMAKADHSQAHTEKLRAKHKDVSRLEAEAAQLRFEGLLEMREVLTDAQLKKFVELRKQGKGGKDGRGFKRGPGREGRGERGPEGPREP